MTKVMKPELIEIDSETSIKTGDIQFVDKPDDSSDEEHIVGLEAYNDDPVLIVGLEAYNGYPVLIEMIDKKIIEDEFGFKPIVAGLKKSTYTKAFKARVDRYRKSHPDVIAKISKKSYEKIKADPVKREKFNKQCNDSAKRKRAELKKEKELLGIKKEKGTRNRKVTEKDPEKLKQMRKEWNKTYREKQKLKAAAEKPVKSNLEFDLRATLPDESGNEPVVEIKEVSVVEPVEVVEKKKKERKPKVVDDNTTEIVEKKGRGRPRKVVNDVIQNNDILIDEIKK
jgi:hypothetical protein